MAKYYFVFGKGGVGKSTMSCALSLKLSQKGRTLILSTDPTHSLSRIFCLEGKGLVEVNKNLQFLEIDPLEVSKRYLKEVLNLLKELISTHTYLEVERLLGGLEVNPAFQESALLEELSLIFKRDYDYFVLDNAPTGQAINLINSVDSTFKLLKKLVEGWGKEERIKRRLEERKNRLNFLKEVLRKCEFFGVLIPESLSLYEIQVTRDFLRSIGRDFSFLIVNRIRGDRKGHREVLREAERRFKGLKLIKIYELREEPLCENLKMLSDALKDI